MHSKLSDILSLGEAASLIASAFSIVMMCPKNLHCVAIDIVSASI